MKKIAEKIRDWNNNWVGDVIGGVCLFAMFYLALVIGPLLLN